MQYRFSFSSHPEEYYICNLKVLVATATLAWGVNLPGKCRKVGARGRSALSSTHSTSPFSALPAHLVIVKGTEYFDGKTARYVDYPLTDVLQMIGRAGRPGYSEEGKAVVMAMEAKKNFYKVRIGGCPSKMVACNNMLAQLKSPSNLLEIPLQSIPGGIMLEGSPL